MQGQDDIHFTQYQWIPFFQNPALGGQINKGDMASGLLFRDQAFTVTPNEYRSTAAYIDSRFSIFNESKLGVSAIFIDDKAGDGSLHTSQIGINTAYHFPLFNEKNLFSIGVQGKLIQRRYGDLNAFVLEEELQNGVRTETLINQDYNYPDLNLGVAYSRALGEKAELQTGLSMHHFNHGIAENDKERIDKYDLRYNIFFDVKYKISNLLSLEPRVQHQRSRVFNSTQVQSRVHYKLSSKSPFTFKLGLGWRVEDALQFLLAVEYNAWEFGFAYDTNTSGLREASGSVAALEFGLKYAHYRPENEAPVPIEEILIEEILIEEILIEEIIEIPSEIFISIPEEGLNREFEIIIIEGQDPIIDTIKTKWPFEYKIDLDEPYYFILDSPDFERDTIRFVPGEYDPSLDMEREFKLIPKEEIEEEVIVETPEIIEEVVIYMKEPFLLDKIFYDFDKDNILLISEEQLTQVYDLLSTYPEMVIELSSHTDVRGTDDYNIELSYRRALSAKNWLVRKGIDSNRIVEKGYGETQLINHCENGVPCSEELHRKNRRTEFKIIAGPTSAKYRLTKKKND